jgi:hypothetical protein
MDTSSDVHDWGRDNISRRSRNENVTQRPDPALFFYSNVIVPVGKINIL